MALLGAGILEPPGRNYVVSDFSKSKYAVMELFDVLRLWIVWACMV